MQIWATPWLPAILAFLVTGLTLAVLRRSKFVSLMTDIPNERSLHSSIVPRIGGTGMLAGLAVALLVLPETAHPVTLATAGYVLLYAVSVVDDVRSLPVLVRLVAHFAVATASCWALGSPVWVAIIAVPLIVWAINLYNFMDGSDGLAGGMTVFGFGTYAIGAVVGENILIAALCGAVAASALAFLLFNFHPASLFLGDSGSVPLGYLAAVLGWYGVSEDLWPPTLPILAFFPFLFDASFTLLRRALRGERIWQPHREHLYQRVIRHGIGHREVALAGYVLMCVFSVVALASIDAGPRIQLAIVGVAFLLCVIATRWHGFRDC
jgi:UDP-N-acetylmuramyl pentapeptide phosphotransferase/UDP-N-acetylglucosamine-1-phosphate transferase